MLLTYFVTHVSYDNSMVHRGNVVDGDTENVDSDLTEMTTNQLIMTTHLLYHTLRLLLLTTMNLSSVSVVVYQLDTYSYWLSM